MSIEAKIFRGNFTPIKNRLKTEDYIKYLEMRLINTINHNIELHNKVNLLSDILMKIDIDKYSECIK